MSYSSLAKGELCNVRPESKCCEVAEAYGLLLYSKLLTDKHDSYYTDNKVIAMCIAQKAASVCGVYADVLTYPKGKSHKNGMRFVIKIPNAEQKKLICERFADENGGILKNECCVISFLRGAFLACGTVTEPQKDYHLEFIAGSERRCDILEDVLKRIEIRSHKLNRNGRWVIYVKDADGISKLMSVMGAIHAARHLEDTRNVRDCRNNANRRVNCDQANIDRIISASEQQCAAIRKLMKNRGIEGIPPELRELAQLRLENPEMSLRDLSESLSEPISRSGVNHRLKRLMELAEETAETEKTEVKSK